MPDLSIYAQPFDPDGFNRAATFAGADRAEAQRVVREDAQITPYVTDFGGSRLQSWVSAEQGRDQTLTAQEANEEFGVKGYLSFSKSETRASADYKSRVANRHMYRDQAMSSYQLSPGDMIWQSLKGGALDPVALPTYAFGFGELRAAEAGAQGVLAIGRNRLLLSGVARGAGENLAGGAILESGNFGLKRAADEDYDFGQAFDNLTVGAVLGGGLGGLGAHMRYGEASKTLRRAPGQSESVVRDRLAAGGLSEPQIRGVMAGIHAESGFNAGVSNPTSGAFGLGQWLGPRKAELIKRYGKNPTAEQQADFLLWELKGGDHGGAAVLAGQSEADVAHAYITKFMRPAAGAETTGDISRASAYLGGEISAPSAAADRATSGGLPGSLQLLSPSERAGINEVFIDYLMDDSRADISALLPTDARPLRRAATGAEFHLSIPARVFEDDVAVTTRGTEVPVKYAIADIKDLRTSHDSDLNPSPDYPQELQPRARDRAGAIARNQQLENEMNPRRLMGSADAESGTPIIGRDGVVESGNGRTIALRRSAERGGEAYGRYIEHLKTQGYDLSGVEHPVLVRVNASDMSHGERIRWTKEANNDTVEQLGAGEKSRSDAAKLPHDALALIDGSDFTTAGNAAFVQAFIKHAAGDATNSMTNAAGEVSAEAVRRIKAALLQRAYDNPRLVERLFEDADPNIKSIGAALQNAAPGMARLRGLIALGKVAPEADISADLNRALDLVMEARDGLRTLRDIVAERIDQVDMLSGDAMSEAQIGLLRALFKDSDFKVGRSVDDMTRALDAYARQASQISEGLDLFGNSALQQVRDSLQASLQLADRTITLGDKRVFTFRPQQDAGDGAIREALGLGRDAGSAERPKPDAGGALLADSRTGGGPAPDPGRPASKVNVAALISADPELKALADDIKALDPEGEIKPKPQDNPETLAEAMRAVAFCMIDGGVKP